MSSLYSGLIGVPEQVGVSKGFFFLRLLATYIVEIFLFGDWSLLLMLSPSFLGNFGWSWRDSIFENFDGFWRVSVLENLGWSCRYSVFENLDGSCRDSVLKNLDGSCLDSVLKNLGCSCRDSVFANLDGSCRVSVLEYFEVSCWGSFGASSSYSKSKCHRKIVLYVFYQHL